MFSGVVGCLIMETFPVGAFILGIITALNVGIFLQANGGGNR